MRLLRIDRRRKFCVTHRTCAFPALRPSMSPIQTIALLSAVTIPPIIIANYLQRRYPRHDLSSLPHGSQIAEIIASPPENVHYPIVDIFITTIPKRYFKATNPSQELSFHFWTSPLIRLEALLLGSRPLPQSIGDVKQETKIANIATCAGISGESYLFRFDIPERLVRQVDYWADRGLSWRMLHGGYHEILTKEEGDEVRIWYLCAPEYGVQDKKVLFWLGIWGHRLYARSLVDVAIRGLRKDNGGSWF